MSGWGFTSRRPERRPQGAAQGGTGLAEREGGTEERERERERERESGGGGGRRERERERERGMRQEPYE